MAYFSAHGNVWYTMPDGTQITVNDLTVFANFKPSWKTSDNLHIEHQIRDGDTPSILSNRLYDSVEFWWTILLLNDIYDMEEQWPKNYEDLNLYISNKYPNQNKNDIHHYIDPNGLIVDLISQKIKYGVSTDSAAIEAGGLEPITIEEYETAINENKRNIVLIDPDYISLVNREYEDQLTSET